MHNLNPIVTNAMANKNGKLGNSQSSPVVGSSEIGYPDRTDTTAA